MMGLHLHDGVAFRSGAVQSVKVSSFAVLAALLIFASIPANAASILYGANRSTHELIAIDKTTGANSAVGAFGFDVTGLAYDSSTGTLYGASFDKQLLTIDISTGAGTVVGSLGSRIVLGLSFDSSGTLYGINQDDDLITINTSTGASSIVGSVGFTSSIGSLAYDPITETLYGADAFSDQLVSINASTGAGTPIGFFTNLGIPALAFDVSTGTLFGAGSIPEELLTLNTLTGADTSIGPLGGSVTGLAFVTPVPVPAAFWLFGSALFIAASLRKRFAK